MLSNYNLKQLKMEGKVNEIIKELEAQEQTLEVRAAINKANLLKGAISQISVVEKKGKAQEKAVRSQLASISNVIEEEE